MLHILDAHNILRHPTIVADRIIKSKFDEAVLKKTRLFVFDDDDLDSSERFVGCFEDEDDRKPSVSTLPGTHLTVSTCKDFMY